MGTEKEWGGDREKPGESARELESLIYKKNKKVLRRFSQLW